MITFTVSSQRRNRVQWAARRRLADAKTKLRHREYLSTDKAANHRARTPKTRWRIFGKRSRESLGICKIFFFFFFFWGGGSECVHWNKGDEELLEYINWFINWYWKKTCCFFDELLYFCIYLFSFVIDVWIVFFFFFFFWKIFGNLVLK